MTSTESSKKWREENPERYKEYHRAYRLAHMQEKREAAQKLRRCALELLGNKCVVCGEADFRVLQIDHIKGDGAKERRTFGNQRDGFYRRIIADPEAASKYQLLCANDNWRKRWDNQEYGRRDQWT